MTREPVLMAMSILGALQVLVCAVAFSDVVGPKWSAFCMAVVAAGQFGVQFWVRGRVTPVDSVTLEPRR